MDPRHYCLIMLALMIIIPGIGYLLWRRHKMRQALVESCLMCDSTQVHVEDADGAYTCHSCAYTTDLEIFPHSRPLVEQYTDLKNALDAFQRGEAAMSWAHAAAVADIATGRLAKNAKHDKMDEASRHMMEGFRIAKDLFKAYPQLKSMPLPGDNLTNADIMADQFIDGVVFSLNTMLKMNESRKQLTMFVNRLHLLRDVLRGQIVHHDLRAEAKAYARTLSPQARREARSVYTPTPDDAGHDAVDPDLARHPSVANRLLLPAGVVAALMLVLGVGYLLLASDEQAGLDKVLVAVSVPLEEGQDGTWWGSGGIASAAFADAVGRQLDATGFEIIPAADPEVLAVIEGARTDDELLDAARKLGAGHVIVGRLETVKATPLAGGIAQEVEVTGELRVLAPSREGYAPEPVKIRRFGAAKSKEVAVQKAVEEAASRRIGPLVDALVSHPDLKIVFRRKSRTREEVQLVDKLRRARAFAALNTELLANRQDRVAVAEKAWRDGALEGSPASLSVFGREEYLVSALPEGAGAIINVDDRTPVLLTGSDKLRYESARERIERVSLDGSRETLVEAYNFFSYPTASSDGGTLSFITDDYGHGMRLYALDIGANKVGVEAARVLWEVTEGRMSAPKLSPGGEKVFVYYRTCRRCPNGAYVIDVASGEREVLRDAEAEYTIDGPQWIDDATLIYLDRPREGGGVKSIVRRRVGGQGEEVLARDDDTFFIESALASADGARLIISGSYSGDPEAELPGHNGLFLFETATRARTPLTKAPKGRNLAFSPDGKRLAIETPLFEEPGDKETYDMEIVRFDLETGEGKALTVNGVRDRYPRWAPDGEGVFFETELDDPLMRTPIMIVRVAR